MSDLIDRQDAIDAIHEDADWLAAQGSDWQVERMERDKSILMSLPSAEKAQLSGEDATFDCISRHKAIEAIMSEPPDAHYPSWYADILKELPSASTELSNNSPKLDNENGDLISRQDAIKYFAELWECIEAIGDKEEWEDVCVTTANEIKSAQPERKTGKWIDIGGVIRYGCPFCHYAQERKSDFCPHCGSCMKGDE